MYRGSRIAKTAWSIRFNKLWLTGFWTAGEVKSTNISKRSTQRQRFSHLYITFIYSPTAPCDVLFFHFHLYHMSHSRHVQQLPHTVATTATAYQKCYNFNCCCRFAQEPVRQPITKYILGHRSAIWHTAVHTYEPERFVYMNGP
jgi:hypothetical protein